MRKRRLSHVGVLLLLAVLIVFALIFPRYAAADEGTRPDDVLERIEEAGSYRFTADVEITLLPKGDFNDVEYLASLLESCHLTDQGLVAVAH